LQYHKGGSMQIVIDRVEAMLGNIRAYVTHQANAPTAVEFIRRKHYPHLEPDDIKDSIIAFDVTEMYEHWKE
jgi:hypothetical protein